MEVAIYPHMLYTVDNKIVGWKEGIASISARPIVGDEVDSYRNIRRVLSRDKCGPQLYIKSKIEIITKYISRIRF